MVILNDFTTSVQKALGEIDPKWRDLPGLIVCGTHTPLNTQSMIDAIEVAREERQPFLGVCFGYQLAYIEWARNVMGIQDATSEELSDTGTFVVKKRPELLVGLHNGESYWSNYTVDETYESLIHFPSNYFVSPAHPEYQSSKWKPHPLLVDFLQYAKNA